MQMSIANAYIGILELHFHGEKILEEKQIAGGRVNSIYKLQTEYGVYTIRIQNNMGSECKQAIGNEEYILGAHNLSSQFIPKVFFIDLTGVRFGYKYIILEYINGTTLDNEGKEDFYKAGQMLAKVHSNSSKFIGKVQSKKFVQSERDVEQYYLQYYSNTLKALDSINQVLANLVKTYLEGHFSIKHYKNQSPVLLHNDVHPRNIIVNNGVVKYIDWDCARYAHREVDFIKFRHLSKTVENKENIDYFMRGYNDEYNLELTPNYKCHEIVWLSKMIVFDSYNPVNDHNYFPDKNYYKNEILKIQSEG